MLYVNITPSCVRKGGERLWILLSEGIPGPATKAIKGILYRVVYILYRLLNNSHSYKMNNFLACQHCLASHLIICSMRKLKKTLGSNISPRFWSCGGTKLCIPFAAPTVPSFWAQGGAG